MTGGAIPAELVLVDQKTLSPRSSDSLANRASKYEPIPATLCRNGIATGAYALVRHRLRLAMAEDFVQWLDEGGNLRCSAPGDNFQNGQAETRINDYKLKVKALRKSAARRIVLAAGRATTPPSSTTRRLRHRLSRHPTTCRRRTRCMDARRRTLRVAGLGQCRYGVCAEPVNASCHRSSQVRHGRSRPSTWTADNSQPMIFVGVSQKHADDVYVFARSFADHPNGPNIRCSRTYRIDNRRYRTHDWLRRAKDGTPRVTRDMESDDDDSTDVPDSEDDLAAEEAAVAQILTSATEDEELEGLFWVKLPHIHRGRNERAVRCRRSRPHALAPLLPTLHRRHRGTTREHDQAEIRQGRVCSSSSSLTALVERRSERA